MGFVASHYQQTQKQWLKKHRWNTVDLQTTPKGDGLPYTLSSRLKQCQSKNWKEGRLLNTLRDTLNKLTVYIIVKSYEIFYR